MITRQYRFQVMGLLAMLTLCGNSAAYAQEETIDVTDQIDLVQESAAEWTFTMLESSITAEVEYEDAVVSVTKKVDNATSTKLFSNMYEAIEAASEGDVVKLCTNISIAKEDDPCETGMLPIEIGTAETPITLDLNGYTLSFPDGGFIDVQSWGYLKIIDSTGGGKVTSANRFAVWVNYGGYMIVEGGCLETTNTTGDPREKSAVYNQGVIFTNAGTISGIEFGIYNEGVVNLGKGKIMASNGVGIEGDGEIAMLDLPVFDCQIKDISLAEDKLIYYSGWVYGVPEKKIVVSLANAEQKTFTYGYNMRTADGGFTDPSKVFSVSGISDKRIGFIDYEMRTEAGIADLTEITFPAGNSTYYDTWALALVEENEDLKFYTVTDVNDKSVELTEIKGKKFSENMPLIVSNTSGKAITAQMVTAQTMMENSFLIDMQEDMDGKYVYPGFEGTDVAIDQIDKMDGFEYYGFNGEDFVPLSNLGPVEAHRCWLGIGEFPDFDEGDEGEGEEGGLPAGARKLSVVWPGSAAKSNTGASGETFNLTLATDAEAHGTVSFSVDGTTLTSDNKTASEGQTVTITVTPTVTQDLAYVVQSITAKPSMTTSQMKVRGSILDEVTLTPAGANTWTMTMPAADVEVGISYGTLTVAKVEIENPQLLTVGKTFEVTLEQTEYAPQEVTLNYCFDPVTGVTVDGVVELTLKQSSGNSATYEVKKNSATKLTFGSVEWKSTGALLTRPVNVTFAGAHVDTSKLLFTNVVSLSANSKMTLCAGFGGAVGTITGTKYQIINVSEGEGSASLSGSDLIFTARTGAKSSPETHNAVMAMEAGICTLSFDNCHVGNALDGLSLTSNSGDDGTVTISSIGGSRSRYKTGCRGMIRGGNAARPFFSFSYSGARIMAKAEDVELHAKEEAQGNTRGAAEQYIVIESGKEYDILTDEDLTLTLKLSEGDILITSITLKVPENPNSGDANGDYKVDAADIVEMINAKNGKASEHFNLTNADINHDRYITQDDIDAVVKLIMKTMNNKENE